MRSQKIIGNEADQSDQDESRSQNNRYRSCHIFIPPYEFRFDFLSNSDSSFSMKIRLDDLSPNFNKLVLIFVIPAIITAYSLKTKEYVGQRTKIMLAQTRKRKKEYICHFAFFCAFALSSPDFP